MNKLYFTVVMYLSLLLGKNAFADESQKGLPQLDFSTYPSLIFWSLLSLFILYSLMTFIITPKIISVINNRHQNIQNNLMKAKSYKEESDMITKKIEEKQDKAKIDAKKLIEISFNESKKLIDQADLSISKKIKSELLKTTEIIKKEKAIKLKEIANESPQMAEKIINKIFKINVNKKELEKIVFNISNKVLKG